MTDKFFKDDVQARVLVPTAQLLDTLKKAISLGKNLPANTKAVELVTEFLTKAAQELNNMPKAAADISLEEVQQEESSPAFR